MKRKRTPAEFTDELLSRFHAGELPETIAEQAALAEEFGMFLSTVRKAIDLCIGSVLTKERVAEIEAAGLTAVVIMNKATRLNNERDNAHKQGG